MKKTLLAGTVLLGAIDLLFPAPVFFRSESVLINLLIAALLAVSLVRPRPALRALLTGIWTGYFFLRAMLYAYVLYFYPLDDATAFRSVFGSMSLAAMLVGERVLRPQLIPLLRRWRLLAEVAPLH